MSGENSSASPTVVAWPQSTPPVPAVPRCMSWFIRPTPMIEPIRVCELDEGRPRYQVPRFQMIAATRSANTMAKPAAEPTFKISSTGSSETMLNATRPEDSSTPRKLKQPDQTTASCAGMAWV